VVNICVGGDNSKALRNWEIDLTDKFNDLINIFFIPNVYKNPFIFIEEKIDTASNSPSSLMVNFNDTWEKWPTFKHCKVFGERALFMSWSWNSRLLARNRLTNC